MKAYIRNPYGYSMIPTDPQEFWGCRPVFWVKLNLRMPITYVDPNGIEWQPNRKFKSDGWSGPAFFNWISKKFNSWYWRAGIFHDSSCRKDAKYRHGLWRKLPEETEFSFFSLTVEESAEKLAEIMYEAENAGRFFSQCVKRLVLTFGPKW